MTRFPSPDENTETVVPLANLVLGDVDLLQGRGIDSWRESPTRLLPSESEGTRFQFVRRYAKTERQPAGVDLLSGATDGGCCIGFSFGHWIRYLTETDVVRVRLAWYERPESSNLAPCVAVERRDSMEKWTVRYSLMSARFNPFGQSNIDGHWKAPGIPQTTVLANNLDVIGAPHWQQPQRVRTAEWTGELTTEELTGPEESAADSRADIKTSTEGVRARAAEVGVEWLVNDCTAALEDMDKARADPAHPVHMAGGNDAFLLHEVSGFHASGLRGMHKEWGGWKPSEKDDELQRRCDVLSETLVRARYVAANAWIR